MVVKRVAVIGAGPAGAIAIDALAQERAFDVIRVFERREGAGGCWIGDDGPPPNLQDLLALAIRDADKPIQVPPDLPKETPKIKEPRFTESSVYPYLETNIDSIPMEFSQEAIPQTRSDRSITAHGEDTPFRHWTVIRDYIRGLVERKSYGYLISYNTTVELAQKVGEEWVLTLRKEGDGSDSWWTETFDAVIVASGHYSVPYVPFIEGLENFESKFPGSIQHSKHFRGRDKYNGKNVVVVGASVSAADISVDLVDVANSTTSVMLGHKANGYFGDEAFHHPRITKKPSISYISAADRSVHFVDGTSISGVDEIIFGTGYTWTLPFLPTVQVRNNRIPGLYLHVVYLQDPSLLFVGAVAAGLTFKIFEWQAVLAARILSGGVELPPLLEQRRWEAARVAKKGDGVPFTLVFPDFEEYFETVRALAGEPRLAEDGSDIGRRLPPFDQEWKKIFVQGHDMRKQMWRLKNARAVREIKDGKAIATSKL